MTVKKIPEDEIRVELGDPVPFAGEKRRDLMLAAALGAPFGTTDPVDLALLSAAARKEDLRHYEQLGYTPPTPEQRLGIARVRRVGSGEEELIARGELDAILYLCRPDQSTRYHAELQAGEEDAPRIPDTGGGAAERSCRTGARSGRSWVISRFGRPVSEEPAQRGAGRLSLRSRLGLGAACLSLAGRAPHRRAEHHRHAHGRGPVCLHGDEG